jgi:DMSO/TMAO reductase YedYZ molybdopterin-dependent catalytic subunit
MRDVMIGRRAVLQATGMAALLRGQVAFADAGAGDAGDAGAGEELLMRQGGSPQNLATPLAYFDRAITPTGVFFVRSHFGPPSLDRTRKVTFDGLVKSPLALGVDELRGSFPEVSVTAVLQCSGNGRVLHRPRVPGLQWVHGGMGQATFTGVRLKDVLAKVGIGKDALHVRMQGADGPPKPTTPAFIRSIPIDRAMDPSTILAYRMNGEDLTLAHGAPLRLIVPGWAGDHWVKWLISVRPQKEEAEGFFMRTGYRMPIEPVTPGAAVPVEKTRPATTFPVKSVIASPESGSKRPLGPQEVVGIAFSGAAPIATVEVSIDGGKTFAAAKLEGEGGVGRAQVFRYRFDEKTPGRVNAVVRAKDKKGNEQPETAAWNPSGYLWNGWHAVEWEVGS